MSAEATEAWVRLLDLFDEQIREVNRGKIHALPDWTAPSDFPPLPDELAGRARSVLERQRSTAARAAEARREIGREITALRALPPTAASAAPVYFDRLA